MTKKGQGKRVVIERDREPSIHYPHYKWKNAIQKMQGTGGSIVVKRSDGASVWNAATSLRLQIRTERLRKNMRIWLKV